MATVLEFLLLATPAESHKGSQQGPCGPQRDLLCPPGRPLGQPHGRRAAHLQKSKFRINKLQLFIFYGVVLILFEYWQPLDSFAVNFNFSQSRTWFNLCFTKFHACQSYLKIFVGLTYSAASIITSHNYVSLLFSVSPLSFVLSLRQIEAPLRPNKYTRPQLNPTPTNLLIAVPRDRIRNTRGAAASAARTAHHQQNLAQLPGGGAPGRGQTAAGRCPACQTRKLHPR